MRFSTWKKSKEVLRQHTKGAKHFSLMQHWLHSMWHKGGVGSVTAGFTFIIIGYPYLPPLLDTNLNYCFKTEQGMKPTMKLQWHDRRLWIFMTPVFLYMKWSQDPAYLYIIIMVILAPLCQAKHWKVSKQKCIYIEILNKKALKDACMQSSLHPPTRPCTISK